MFGHQNDVITQDQKQDADVTLPDTALDELAATNHGQNTQSSDDGHGAPVQGPPPAGQDDMYNDDHRHEQPEDHKPHHKDKEPSPIEPPRDDEMPGFSTVTSGAPSQKSNTSSPTDLLDIKNEALHDLSPLVDKLDLEAEEKFKTVMMLIQASDDQTLIPKAYNLAKAITDEKAKAQALLDVVNEINYFTQKNTKKD